MPEQNHERERIAGETTVTPSSDAAIEAVVNGLKREIAGLPQNDLVLEGETLKPITQPILDKEKDFMAESTNIIRIDSRLDHKASRFGLSVLKGRVEKKAA